MGAEKVPKAEPALPVSVPTFRELFEREFSYVWNVLRRLGVTPRELEDVTQQVFLQIHARLSSFDGSRPLRPWLFAFAFRAASNHRNLARHRVELCIVAPDIADSSTPPDEQLIAREERELAELALTRVPLERRAVLLLHEIEGHTAPEIARTLDVPLNTVYSRLRLARQEYEVAVRRLRARRGES
jgi:RNA polymerase sigma-70 factor (ECF subfamily)